MSRFGDFIKRKQDQYGDKFDASDISAQFVPYFESGQRIEVDLHMEGIKRGRVGITTGWKPVFLLILTARSLGSSITLSDKDKVIGTVKGKRRYYR